MRYTLLLVVLFSFCTGLLGQIVPKPDQEDSAKLSNAIQYLQVQEHIPKAPRKIQSPNAASFGSYGEIPVSLYTGKPEISVDLYEVSDGPVKLPISLVYDAAGVRPEQHPGWVGMNFTLSTHFAITRTVRDAPDDNKPNASTLGEHGYAYHTALLNGADWSQNAGIIAIANTTLNQIHIDTEPDEFSFSAPGFSGKFYLGSDAKWKVQSERPVKVQLINSGTALYPPFTPPTFTGNQWDSFNNQHYAEHFEGFIITDEFGVQYIFGGSDNSCMEYSLDFFNQGKSNWTCNSWYLKSIVRPTGQSIQFLYERGDFVAQMYLSIYNKMARVNGGKLFSCNNWSSLIGQMGPYNGKLISPIYLKQITADNFRVIYNTSVSNELPYSQDIREMVSYDPGLVFPSVTKKYYYLASFSAANPDTSSSALSSGVLGGKAQYYCPDYKPLPETAGVLVEEDIFSTQSVLPISENAMGIHIGYSQVIERSSTEGWKVHQFSSFDNGYRDEAPSGFLQPSATPYSARSVKTLVELLCQTNHKVYEGTASLIDVRKFLPTEITQNTYDQDNPGLFSSSVTSRMYWPNGQLDTEGQSDSRGRVIKNRYRYPPNQGDAASIAMTSKHIIGPVVEVLNYTGLDVSPTPIKTTAISYDLFTGNYQPKKVESKLGLAPSFTTDIEFLTYDPRGNLLTYKELNGAANKLEYFGPADAGKADLLKKRTVADGTSTAQSTHYDYKPAVGVETIQDPNGKTTFYEYDSFNRLKSAISNNAGGPKRATYCYNLAGQVVDCAALATTGTVSAPPLLLISEAALPVTLVEFVASRREHATLLSWVTTYESNSDHFAIERSANGKQWELIGTVQAHQESDERQSYTFTDSAPLPSENLYRLKMVDRDGSYAYSRIQSVTFGDQRDAVLYPNPISVGDKLQTQVTDPSSITHIAIFDSGGDQVLSVPWQPEIDVSGLPAGVYLVRIAYRDGSTSVHRIAKQ